MEEQACASSERNVKRRKKSVEMTLETLDNSPDRISSLPDDLLLHILSFLEMRDVIKTCVLSTRWRYLWGSMLCLNFNGRSYGTNTVHFIDNSLSNHEGSKVKKLLIYILCKDARALQLDSWIQFAATHNVEELTLDCDLPGVEWLGSIYKLPHSLFSCRSLTTLKLCFCDLNLPASLHLTSLKILALEFLDVSADKIMHLTSGCPLLEDLYLRGCNRLNDLNIVIANKNLKFLKIEDYPRPVNLEPQMMISAPDLLSLEFQAWTPRKVCDVKRLSSLITVSFQARSCCLEDSQAHAWARLLDDLHHVKELTCNSCVIQVLSVREVQGFNCIPLDATCIELQTGLSNLELPGIFYLLKSSSKLETLTLKHGFTENIKVSDELLDKFEFDETKYLESKESEFSSLLQNLKTVRLNFAVRPSRNAIRFLIFLLKSLKALERMIIILGKPYSNYPEVICSIREKLLAFPRASPDAEIYIELY